MRVLHFFKTYWPDTFGGMERTIHALAKGGVQHGITCDVLTLSPNASDEPIEFDGHRVHQVPLGLELASTGLSTKIFGRFRDLSKDADLIHYHFPWPMMDLVELTTQHKKPTVVSYQSDIVKQKLLFHLYRPLMHRFLGRVDRIAASSPNYLATSPVLQAHKDKTVVVPLGLNEQDYPSPDPERLARWKAKFPDGFFLFTGVLRYYKGIHILFEAVKACGLPVAVLGGNGIEAELQARRKAEGVDAFHMLGALPDEDKIALLTLCRGLVFPSHLRSEAYGLSLVEACMHGKPMISCEIGTGTSFVNLNDETGIAIPPADPEALARAMKVLWDDDGLAEQYGRNARLRYEAMFTSDRMVNSYVQIYRELLGK